MIKSIKTKFSRNLLLFIFFALLLFMSACGGTLDSTAGDTSKGSISLSSSSASLAAGESSIITATVLDGTGSVAQGRTVTFTLLSNKSGATVKALNGGETDSNGQAIATYTAGSSNPNTSVEDSIQVSTGGATNVIFITRASSSSTAYRLSLTADSASLTAGTTTIIRATVTDGSGNTVGGQAVTFTLLQNNSGATLTTLSLGTTDTSGQALAIYSAGSSSPTLTVQDTIQASITGATGVVIITRTPSTASATGLSMTLTADATSLTAGNSTLIRATVTGSTGPAIGQTVSFSFLRNNSGGTLTVLNGGQTDANGQAIATYTAGSDTPTLSVQDTIQASLTGTVGAIIITRTSGGGTSAGLLLTLTADATSVAAGQSTIITAKVTNGTGSPVQGETVTFGFAPGGNQSGAAITVLNSTTDAAGVATALYAAGSLTGATVQDIVQASITGSTKAIIITKTGTASGVTASSIDLYASPTSIKTDGASASTITVNALNSLNASLSGVVVTIGADTGVLSAPTVTTPGNVTFTSGSNRTNRTATITATAGSATKTILINITGSTVSVNAGSSSISTTGSTTLIVTAKDFASNAVPGQTVTLSQSGTGSVAFGSATGTTDAGGTFQTTIAGNTNGAVNIFATALGATGSTTITVTDAATVFHIDQQRLCTGAYPGSCAVVPGNPNPTAMQLGSYLELEVNAAGAANVVFATSTGTFTDPATPAHTGSLITVPAGNLVAGKATAYLSPTSAGIATINVYDAANTATRDNLSVAITSATPYSVTIQATPTVVPTSVGTTTHSSRLIAMVRDVHGAPVGNALVMFTIVNPTGGGETVSDVVVPTAATTAGGHNLGEAQSSFTSGSMPSGQYGVQIRATVAGTTVQTGTAPSGNDASIVISGVAGSISFGQATVLRVDSSNANYILDMSAVVADANGNPAPDKTLVNLSLWPIAWSTGHGCSYDPDGCRWDYSGTIPACLPLTDDGPFGTFKNEDKNENLILDAGEDGWREWYAGGSPDTVTYPGTPDTYITPVNSAAGTVPATVYTDVNGVASFSLVYPKTSSIWTVVRLRASTLVQGTETVGQVIFRLAALIDDVTPVCKISGSPYQY